MGSQARVVVIGGGVVGCSVLYHLTKLGCRDVVLLERRELTAGSSWHAAGGFHALNSDPNVARLQAYTIEVYEEIERISGQSVGLEFTGGLNIAATRERWDFLRADSARHRVLGLETELVGPDEVHKLCPFMDVSEVLGAIYDPKEGRLDPSGATHAYAKAARVQGAEIYRQTPVTGLSQRANGEWEVATPSGTIVAEHVVNAAGLWARDVGKLVGLDLPIVAMEHHYLLTEAIPEVAALGRKMPIVLDLDGEIYLMQERNGVLLGVYEKEATPWALQKTPEHYGEQELLPPQIDRLAESLDKGFRRFPALAKAGIRRIINGPFTFSPDGNPLVGPVRGLRNYWAACGVMAGFAQGGGVGLTLAQWILNGEPDSDVLAMDVARFGPHATRTYSIAKAREFYARRFQIAYPNEYWPAGRPAKCSPIHAALEARGAVFGVSYGLEVPLYYAASPADRLERPSLRRSNAFPIVREECLSARTSVGALDLAGFGKYVISGPAAARRLDRLLASRLPDVGRIRLAPLLSPRGTLMGDLTALRLATDEFLLVGSGYLQEWHGRWFDEHLAGPGVAIRNVTDELGGIAIFGPHSRELLQRLSTTDPDCEALPFLGVRRSCIGLAPAIVARLSVTGELGFELYVPAPCVAGLFDQLERELRSLDGRMIGLYALNSLRLEKSIGIWSREYSRDYTPRMAGLDRWVDYGKANFIGQAAAIRDRETPPLRRLVTLSVGASDADASGYEPILQGGRYVGFVTSGGYGHAVEQSLAMGYVESAVRDEATDLTVTIVGERRPARILTRAAYDSAGVRMRDDSR